eukprot:gene4259-5329_t
MKFRQYLESHIIDHWRDRYIDYEYLKTLISNEYKNAPPSLNQSFLDIHSLRNDNSPSLNLNLISEKITSIQKQQQQIIPLEENINSKNEIIEMETIINTRSPSSSPVLSPSKETNNNSLEPPPDINIDSTSSNSGVIGQKIGDDGNNSTYHQLNSTCTNTISTSNGSSENRQSSTLTSSSAPTDNSNTALVNGNDDDIEVYEDVDLDKNNNNNSQQDDYCFPDGELEKDKEKEIPMKPLGQTQFIKNELESISKSNSLKNTSSINYVSTPKSVKSINSGSVSPLTPSRTPRLIHQESKIETIIKVSACNNIVPPPPTTLTTTLEHEYDDTFEAEFKEEADKIDLFFVDRFKKFKSKSIELCNMIPFLMENKHLRTNRNINYVKNGFRDIYRFLIMLDSFRKVNIEGFNKLIIKYEKHNYIVTESCRKFLHHKQFYQQEKQMRKLIHQIKHIFARFFTGNDTKLAKQQMKAPNPGENKSVIFTIGILIGMCVILGILVVYTYVAYYPHDSPPLDSPLAWLLFRISLLPILLGTLFGLQTFVWDKTGINYIFIFQLKPEYTRSSLMYFKYGLMFIVLWLLCLYFYIDSSSDIGNFKHIPSISFPIIFILLSVSITVLPFPIFAHTTRFWVLKRIGKVMSAPFVAVKFSDFFMSVQLLSLGEFLFNIQSMVCVFNYNALNPDEIQFCTKSGFWAFPLLNALPYYWRIMQCVRRYYETKRFFPHMTSAIRSIFSLIALLLAYLAMSHTHDIVWTELKIIWFIVNVIGSFYKWYADLAVDWGFLLNRKTNSAWPLREKLVYKKFVRDSGGGFGDGDLKVYRPFYESTTGNGAVGPFEVKALKKLIQSEQEQPSMVVELQQQQQQLQYSSSSAQQCNDGEYSYYCGQGVYSVDYIDEYGNLLNGQIDGLYSSDIGWVQSYLNTFPANGSYTCYLRKGYVGQLLWWQPPKYNSYALAWTVVLLGLSFLFLVLTLISSICICHHNKLESKHCKTKHHQPHYHQKHGSYHGGYDQIPTSPPSYQYASTNPGTGPSLVVPQYQPQPYYQYNQGVPYLHGVPPSTQTVD